MKPYYKLYELKAIEKGNWVLFEDLEHYFQVERIMLDMIKIKVCWVDVLNHFEKWETTKLFINIKDFNKWYMRIRKEWSYCNAR